MADELETAEEFHMESLKSKVKHLEYAVAVQMEAISKHKDDITTLKECCEKISVWGRAQVAWSKEVTAMLRLINWDALQAAYPGGTGTNPPQTPPDWPL